MLFKAVKILLVPICLCIIATFAWAEANGTEVEELTLAGYSVPILVSIILGLFYKFVPSIPDRLKTPLSVLFGILLGIVAMYYNKEGPLDFRIWIDHILYGMMVGTSATGLYELQRSALKPRS